ncbi:putative ATP-dependent helicase C23E6.02 [Hordeum vulgare]|nr:putative ATP-dependent helicase C23E6.02 [Hordeum vulgare]
MELGRRDNGDTEQRHCVIADAERKRSALQYTNHGLSPTPFILRREMEEYDHARGRLFSGAGNSSGASSSRSSLTRVKREPEELSPLRAVKRELEADAEPERRAGGVVGPEDFLPSAEADAFEAAILTRNVWEEEEQQCR